MDYEIKTTYKFLQNYRESALLEVTIKATEIAEKLEVEKLFPSVRSRLKKKTFLYESVDKTPTLPPEEKFRADFFLPLLDVSMTSLKERFEQISHLSDLYGFLYQRDGLIKAYEEKSLASHCINLQTCMGDIEADELEMKLKRFVIIIRDKENNLKTSHDFLNYLYKEETHYLYPNLCIALRLLLTSPVTVATAERSFSKLKLIKTFHR